MPTTSQILATWRMKSTGEAQGVNIPNRVGSKYRTSGEAAQIVISTTLRRKL